MFVAYLSLFWQMQDSSAQQGKTEIVHKAVPLFTAF
jgi:hypothetical protein